MVLQAVMVLAFIHGFVPGVMPEGVFWNPKLDWKHVANLSSGGSAYHDWKLRTKELAQGRTFGEGERHIPVMGVGLNNDPFSLLMRLFYSIDCPIDKIVLVTANPVDQHVQRELNHITRHFPNVVVRQSKGPWLGVAETWNTIILEDADVPWVFIVSLDVEFSPGSLQRLAAHAWTDWDNRNLDQAFIEYCNEGMSGGYSAFIMFRSIVAKVGLFDENIFPAYYEDSEYDMRLTKYNASVPLSKKIRRDTYRDVVAFHGLPTEAGGTDARGVVSWMTDTSSIVPKERIFRAVDLFILPYLREKWGCNFSIPAWDKTCTFAAPFNQNPQFSNFSSWQHDKLLRAKIMAYLMSNDTRRHQYSCVNMVGYTLFTVFMFSLTAALLRLFFVRRRRSSLLLVLCC